MQTENFDGFEKIQAAIDWIEANPYRWSESIFEQREDVFRLEQLIFLMGRGLNPAKFYVNNELNRFESDGVQIGFDEVRPEVLECLGIDEVVADYLFHWDNSLEDIKKVAEEIKLISYNRFLSCLKYALGYESVADIRSLVDAAIAHPERLMRPRWQKSCHDVKAASSDEEVTSLIQHFKAVINWTCAPGWYPNGEKAPVLYYEHPFVNMP